MTRAARYLYYEAHDKSDLPDTFPKGFVYLAGRFINVYQLAASHDLDYSYLYRMFRGERTPSLAYAQRIAAALEMETHEFIREMDLALKQAATLEVEEI